MALWLVRAGRVGEYEKKFLSEKRLYLTWDGLKKNLKKVKKKIDLYHFLLEKYPEDKPNTARNWTGQLWPFAQEMKEGDWVIMPSKLKSAIHIAEITSDYVYNPKAENPYFHHRSVKWIEQDIPRSNFDQDLLYSFGAFMTVCRIQRNDAEKRVRAMQKNKWQATKAPVAKSPEGINGIDEEGLADTDLELHARDQIAKFIIRKFKGHGMERLVEAILQAQGYTTYRSPEGADKGVDILAAPGSLGFGTPRLCIQVKTSETPVDRPTLDQLVGSMQNFNADQGLLVSWSGFKGSIDKEVPAQFFRVRLWDQDAIIQELMKTYEKLDEDIRAEIPLKRIWTLALQEE